LRNTIGITNHRGGGGGHRLTWCRYGKQIRCGLWSLLNRRCLNIILYYYPRAVIVESIHHWIYRRRLLTWYRYGKQIRCGFWCPFNWLLSQYSFLPRCCCCLGCGYSLVEGGRITRINWMRTLVLFRLLLSSWYP